MRVFTQLGRLGLVGLGRGRKIRKNQILLTTTQKQNAMTPARRNRNNWLPSIFNDFLAPEWLEHRNTTAPAVNILEDDTCYRVEVAAPGMTRDDFKVHINEDNELIISLEKSSAPKEEEIGEAQGHLPAPRILLHAVPAEPASARQCRARQDRGQGRERRDDHRHSEEEGVGNDADRPSDRGALAHALPPVQRSSGIGAPFRFAGHPPHFCFCAPAVAVTAAGH